MGKISKAIVFAFLALSLPCLCANSEAAGVAKELKGIKKKIEREKRGISKVQNKEASVLGRLEDIEKALDEKNKQLKKINSRLDSILKGLQKSETQSKRIRSFLQARRRLLKKRARALYKWQKGGSPFILLNGGLSVAELVRRKRYLELMLAYDKELLNGLRRESDRQEGLKRKLVRKRKSVNRERRVVVQVKESIRLDREKKRIILSSLHRQKKIRERALKELERASRKLQKMMEDMSRRAVVRFKRPPSALGFRKMKGKLDYPVRGAVKERFGKAKHPEFSAEVFHKGIEIQAPLGEEIKAVERGKVVFADRFLGYGRMMIVDHGKRYYSIYAHLSDLLKKTGELVKKGEPIALVGDSGSLRGSRLYFEIRKGGKPLDPLPWFKKR
ncbi:MAG: murein hydrolase activator EnvC family protein [Candidatus Binatia bacterium]